MKKCILIFLSIISNYLYAQQTVQGLVVDQADHRALVNASVVLLDIDSIMRYFTRTDQSGKFKLEKIEKGEYLLLVTYLQFKSHSQPLGLDNKSFKVDSIKISSQSNLLEEVVIDQITPLKNKVDTIEYDAGCSEPEKNAKLEDLLRRLP